jgi:hypothetical protein
VKPPHLALLLAAGVLAGAACDPTVRAGTSVRLPGADGQAAGGPGIAPDGGDADHGVDAGAVEAATAPDADQTSEAGATPEAGPLVSDPLTLDDAVPVQGREQTDPAVGFDGERYLIVFTDQRAGRPDWSGEDAELDVYATRMRADGTVLDAGGFPIVTGFGDQYAPAIAFDGTHYLLVYYDLIQNPIYENAVMALRLDRDGTPIDPAPVQIGTTGPSSTAGPPNIAFNGADFLVGWMGAGGMLVREIGTDGVPVGDPLLLSDSASAPDASTLWIATDGDGFLVVWGRSARIVTAQGTAPAPAFPLLAAPGRYADNPTPVAYGGGVYLVAWTSVDPDSGWVNATRVSAAGAVLDSPPLKMGVIPHAIGVVDTPIVGGMAYDPAVSEFNVFWVSNSSVGRAFVLPDGTVNDDGFGAAPDYPDTGGTRAPPIVNLQNEQFFLAWRSSFPGDNERVGLRSGLFGHLLSGFEVGSTLPLVETANEQLSPAVGSNGDGFLVVWADSRNQELGQGYLGVVTDIYGVRLDGAGRVLDPAGIPIARAPMGQSFPALASDGDRYLVVWTDGRAGDGPAHIYGTFVTRDGAVTDPSGFQISDGAPGENELRPSVAWGGSSYLVTWQVGSGGARAVMVSPQGQVMGPLTGFSACDRCTDAKVAAAADGTFLVVGDNGPNQEGTFAVRISSAGVVLDPVPIVLDPSTSNELGAAVASDGNEFLAIWAGSQSGATNPTAGARISTSGQVLSTFALSVGFYPIVAFDGSQYLVAWQETRDDGSGFVNGGYRQRADDNIMGVHVSRSGQMLEPAPFAIAATSADEVSPALASNRAGATIAAYTWPRLDPGYGSRRTGARMVTGSTR